jgi:hypothetical protein
MTLPFGRLKSENTLDFISLERVKGIEPSSQAWEARILPLNHTRSQSRCVCIKENLAVQLFWSGQEFSGTLSC